MRLLSDRTIFFKKFDWHTAEDEFRRAAELKPSDATVHNSYAVMLMDLKRYVEAETEVRRAHELDPLANVPKVNQELELPLLEGKLDEVIRNGQDMLSANPLFMGTYLPLIEAYTLKGLGDKAISARRAYYAATGDSELDEAMGKEFVRGRFSGAIKAEIAIMLARMQTKHVSKIEVAIRYAQVKDRNQTIIWLERAFSEQEDVVDWINDPIFDFLGDDARFNALLRRMNLPWARS
jgi:tetratricopeptide (TPR) repeat protein